MKDSCCSTNDITYAEFSISILESTRANEQKSSISIAASFFSLKLNHNLDFLGECENNIILTILLLESYCIPFVDV